MYAYIYWIILISSVIPTPIVVSDHYADHHMGTAIKVLRSLMHNTVFTSISIRTKINILEICWVSKETLMHNSNTIISHCICHSIVKIIYTGEGKEGISENSSRTEELRCTTLCTTTMHTEMYVCIYVFYCLLLWTFNAYLYELWHLCLLTYEL